MTAFIAYLRVSTEKQGDSGLGLAAQQEAVARFVRAPDAVMTTFVEVESGRKNERPQLAAALKRCRESGAVLLIAKLDRLARNVAFIAKLMESDVRFVACDMPTADPFRLHIEAAVAEEEARKISQRTKAALAAAKAKGVKLGGFRGRYFSADDLDAGIAVRQDKSAAFAARVLPAVEAIKASGASTLREIAAGLTARGISTQRGGDWTAMQVSRVLSRAVA